MRKQKLEDRVNVTELLNLQSACKEYRWTTITCVAIAVGSYIFMEIFPSVVILLLIFGLGLLGVLVLGCSWLSCRLRLNRLRKIMRKKKKK